MHIYLDRPPLCANNGQDGHQLFACAYHKLLLRSKRSFGTVRTKPKIVTTEEDSIEYAVFVDRTVPAPAMTRNPPINRTQPSNNPSDGSLTKKILKKRFSKNVFDQYYASNCIVLHVEVNDKRKYDVQWYGYTPADDTIKVSKHILQSFLTTHWKCLTHETKTEKTCKT